SNGCTPFDSRKCGRAWGIALRSIRRLSGWSPPHAALVGVQVLRVPRVLAGDEVDVAVEEGDIAAVEAVGAAGEVLPLLVGPLAPPGVAPAVVAVGQRVLMISVGADVG